jgi:RimJ/RimL family protein N-acetyltransferase
MQWTSQGTVDSSEDESRTWLEQFIYDDDQTERRNYNFVVLKRPNPSTTPSDVVYETQEDDSTFIGVLGIYQFDPLGLPCLGYMFLPEAWGKGYATEALGGFQKAWWDLPRDDPMVFSLGGLTKELRPGSIRAYTNKSNMPSAAVLRKNGWVAEKEFQNGDKVIVSWIIRGPVDD